MTRRHGLWRFFRLNPTVMIIIGIIVGLALTVTALALFFQRAGLVQYLQESKKSATRLATEYAINECRRDDVADDVCESISVKEIVQGEQEGNDGWRVMVASEDGYEYTASAFVTSRMNMSDQKVITYNRYRLAPL